MSGFVLHKQVYQDTCHRNILWFAIFDTQYVVV